MRWQMIVFLCRTTNWTYCDIIRNVFVLCLGFLAQSSSDPWNFLSDRTIFCPSWGAPFEFILMRWLKLGPLDSLRIKLVTRKRKKLGARTFSSTHQPLGRGEGEGGSRLSSINTLEQQDWMSYQVGQCIHKLGVGANSSSVTTEAPALGTLGDLALYLFIWLFICILYNIFYNKLMNTNKCFSEFLSNSSKLMEPKDGVMEIWSVGWWSFVGLTSEPVGSDAISK